MAGQVNLREAFRQAAGLNPPYVFTPRQQQTVESFNYQNVQVLDGDQLEEPAGMGIAVFMSLKFEKKEYTYRGTKKTSPEMRIPCCIVEVNFTKHIVDTIIFGRKGVVSQHISMGDYHIKIMGVLSNDDKKFPFDLLNNLRRICECPFAVSVTHPILNRMGIMDIKIRGGSPVAQNQGGINKQPFSLDCDSDETFELKLKSEADIKKV